jgi:hypothetical protein
MNPNTYTVKKLFNIFSRLILAEIKQMDEQPKQQRQRSLKGTVSRDHG